MYWGDGRSRVVEVEYGGRGEVDWVSPHFWPVLEL